MQPTKETGQPIALPGGADLVQGEHLCRTISTHAQMSSTRIPSQRNGPGIVQPGDGDKVHGDLLAALGATILVFAVLIYILLKLKDNRA